ncbi:(S)-acetoin forming diacetyl reductase [Weissella diestrammenae]|uniref:diacetyl reductase [(S)-acetoin forming] n=1 Tax=Weissella diestrammenae TaxID=1162633 RepID=A0A7G9T591_9LACO|nr:(S)-acetoin forming diacetyl reductase [Weissella diestrammenae]MCM0583122.1 (S)-acetoin forming diacetyl reductase [Weissella diestrammenae]QNN75266.1 (S)-acetoin forming diacetyl reductase [Weissella diestrammenae]
MAKVAIVTGAAQGIGLAIAQRLYEDDFKVALVDYKIDVAQVAAADLGPNAIALQADVSKRDDMFRVVHETVEKLGDLNVLVNNAGLGPTTPIDTITEEQFKQVYGVNVGGVLWGTQAAHEAFKKLGHGGKIINATSQAGVVGNPELALYSGTKFAVRGITQVTARDLASENITVNAYAPGIVKTPMMFDIAHEVGQNAGKDDDWGMQQFAKDIALKRLSEPSDVANVVSFLAGSDSDYITGQTIIVDGGMQFH